MLLLLLLLGGGKGGGGGTVDCLSANAKKVLDNPRNEYVVSWIVVCGVGRDFEYKLVYDKNFVAEIRSDNPELDAQIKREIAEVERLSKIGKGICPSEVIEKCKNAA